MIANFAPTRSRAGLYGAINAGFILYTWIAAFAGTDTDPRLLYLALLFALCSSPLLFIRKLNDRHTLYTIFLVIYFVSYGIIDVTALTAVGNGIPVANPSILTTTEALIVLSGIAFALGYRVSVGTDHSSEISRFAADDWPLVTLVILGLLLWTVGTIASWYWNIQLTVRSLEINLNVGQGLTTAVMLGRYAQPIGILILAYAYVIARTKFLWLIIIAIVVFQVYFGFVTNTKGGAMLGGILVIVTSYMVNGKLPKTWLIAGALFITVAFPIFQAYRIVVVGESGLTNAQAARNVGQVLQMAIHGQQRATDEHAASFFERSSVKTAVEMIVRRTGVDVPYQHGYTLIPLATAFIPRIVWPDKLDVQTGVLVNQQFRLEDAVVYISPSHLGELYWNFGWPGAIIGMLLLGLLLGFTNRLCDLSAGTSVARVLILAVTIYQTGVRFEGSIAAEYSVWVRSIAGIMIMQRLFSRRGLRHTAAQSHAQQASVASDGIATGEPRTFPNLMT